MLQYFSWFRPLVQTYIKDSFFLSEHCKTQIKFWSFCIIVKNGTVNHERWYMTIFCEVNFVMLIAAMILELRLSGEMNKDIQIHIHLHMNVYNFVVISVYGNDGWNAC